MRYLLAMLLSLFITTGTANGTAQLQRVSSPFYYSPVVANHSTTVSHRVHGGHSYKRLKKHRVLHRQTQSIRAQIRNPVGPIVEVETAANIKIRVADSLAPKFQGFIKDLVEEKDYVPRQIHCYSTGGHVLYSRHYAGAACDFDQRGWGLTSPSMHTVTALARKWGLRDGCSFTDCGHIDDGRISSKTVAKHWPLMYKEIDKGG